MEETSEVHEEDKVLPENNKKRMLKTPSQVEALEKLYNEHKYPSESIKAQLAEEIGLSEKQVSGWFCHRRLKDKNMLKDESHLIGRQDLSSGIIQDRGSALKQDSCSSTKAGEYRHFDPREVESRRFCAQDSPAADRTYGSKGQYMHARNYSTMDNASSGSSSASQERMFPQRKDPYDMEPLRYSSRSRKYLLMNTKDSKNRGHIMGSGYVHSQDEIENDAILAVRMQLGRHYREDGPPLGVNFESLPPSAFDSPVGDATNGPYYVGDSILPKSVGVLKVHKEPTSDTEYTQYNRVMCPHNSCSEGEHLKRIRLEPDHQNDCSSYQSLRKSSLTKCRNYSPDQYSAMDNIDEDPSGMTSMLNKSRKPGIRSMHGVEGIRTESITNKRHHPYGGEVFTRGSSFPRLHNHDGSSSHVLQRGECHEGRPPMILPYDEFLGTEHREHSRMTKEERPNKERRKRKEYANSARVKMQMKNEIRRGKTTRGDEFLPREYASKTPSPHALLPWENQKGCAGEMPTSFSDDETVATNSSID